MRNLFSALLGSAAAAGLSLSAAFAADLPMRGAPPAPYVGIPVFTWTGFYVGANVGYGFGTSNSGLYDPTYGAITASSASNGGILGGGQVGFNYQFTPGSGFVVGLEADIQAASLGASSVTYTIGTRPYYDVGSSLDWFGTARARAGYAFDRFLVYGTGGFAYGGGSANTNYSSLYPSTSAAGTRTGYAVGGGVEYAFTNNLSAKIEGLYVNLNRGSTGQTYYSAATNSYYGNAKSQDDVGVIRAGLNYRFSSF